MNANRRKQIRLIADEMLAIQQRADDLMSQIEALRDEEQEYLDNMPEALQSSDRGEAAEAAVEALDSARDEAEGVSAACEMAMQALDTAAE